jgi:hypothetical protein
MSSAVWQILCYDFYCSIIIASCDLVDLYYIWKREDRIPDILLPTGAAEVRAENGSGQNLGYKTAIMDQTTGAGSHTLLQLVGAAYQGTGGYLAGIA